MNSTIGINDRTASEQRGAPEDERLVRETRPRRQVSPLTWIAPVFFGLIWVVDAYLKWQPAFQRHFLSLVQAGAGNQPGWLKPWYHFWLTALQPHASLYAHGVAVVETIIALSLILGFARKLVYIGGALYSIGIWAIPEGFGNFQRAASTDLGPSIAYVAVFAALWALDSCTGPRPFSLDALIERRFRRWKHIAEVRR